MTDNNDWPPINEAGVFPAIDTAFRTRPCTICHRPIIDLPGAPLFCSTHDPEPKTVDTGQIVQIGEHDDYIAEDVRRVGLFAHIVYRYRKYKTPVHAKVEMTTWIDKDTGRRMGSSGVRPFR